MPETKGARDAIHRMAKSIVEGSKGKVSKESAYSIAKAAAIRHDNRKENNR